MPFHFCVWKEFCWITLLAVSDFKFLLPFCKGSDASLSTSPKGLLPMQRPKVFYASCQRYFSEILFTLGPDFNKI